MYRTVLLVVLFTVSIPGREAFLWDPFGLFETENDGPVNDDQEHKTDITTDEFNSSFLIVSK